MTSILYPVTENLKIVDDEVVQDYLETLFSQVMWKPHHFICLRGIGEKGTIKEGGNGVDPFREDHFIQPGLNRISDDELVQEATRHVRRWSQYHVATFIVPAVLKEARGHAESVGLMTAAVVDLDSGDTYAKAAWLEQHVGTPTMAVASGGTTDAGTPKLHLYWVFEEAVADVPAVVEVRHQLALKVGGDLAFGRGTDRNPYGRAHQPIRVPGSVHAKGGSAKPVAMLHNSREYVPFEVFKRRVDSAPRSPWAHAEKAAVGLGFDFGPDKNFRPDLDDSLLEEVHEGGEDRTRWSEFNRVAGYHIALIREGKMGAEEARDATHGWMLAKMVPPWPIERFQREWHALLQVDSNKHGPLPSSAVRNEAMIRTDLGMREWAMYRWTQTKAPPREFIVDGLVLAGKPHLLVAEGGAGKTFAMLDLALKVASAEGDEVPTWLGQPVRGRGTVVMLTTEDDADELHRRIESLDKGGLRFRAGDRLIVMPTLNAGGGFTLAEKDRSGRAVPSARWLELMAHLRALEGLKLVVVDTLNSTLHGEENSATVINEYVRMLHPVCGELGAALVLTHHIRKQNNQAGGTMRPISSLDDMFNAIRGSSALPAAFRAVLGMWHSHDYAKRMTAMGMEPKAKSLWRFGVLKANNPEMVEGIRFLLRNADGMLEDVSRRAIDALAGQEQERQAWLTLAVRLAAEAGAPYVSGGKDSAGGIYQRRGELHPCLRDPGFGRTKLLAMVERLVSEGVLVVRNARFTDQRGRKRDLPVVDVKEGPFDVEGGGNVQFGASFVMPDGAWDRLYTFDPVDGSLGSRDRPKMVMAGLPRQEDGDTQTLFDDVDD